MKNSQRYTAEKSIDPKSPHYACKLEADGLRQDADDLRYNWVPSALAIGALTATGIFTLINHLPGNTEIATKACAVGTVAPGQGFLAGVEDAVAHARFNPDNVSGAHEAANELSVRQHTAIPGTELSVGFYDFGDRQIVASITLNGGNPCEFGSDPNQTPVIFAPEGVK